MPRTLLSYKSIHLPRYPRVNSRQLTGENPLLVLALGWKKLPRPKLHHPHGAATSKDGFKWVVWRLSLFILIQEGWCRVQRSIGNKLKPVVTALNRLTCFLLLLLSLRYKCQSQKHSGLNFLHKNLLLRLFFLWNLNCNVHHWKSWTWRGCVFAN